MTVVASWTQWPVKDGIEPDPVLVDDRPIGQAQTARLLLLMTQLTHWPVDGQQLIDPVELTVDIGPVGGIVTMWTQ